MAWIATWFYADAKEECNNYSQVGSRSDSETFQRHYWRCLAVFYLLLDRYHPEVEKFFFTNVPELPVVAGTDFNRLFARLGITKITLPFRHQPPAGYCQSWRNQFYLFSINDWLAQQSDPDQMLLVLDSDCLIRAPINELVAQAATRGYMTFLPLPQDDVADDFPINGLSKQDLGVLFSELLPLWPADQLAPYFQGEFLFISVAVARLFQKELQSVWPWTLQRQQQGQSYFHEEAQLLSYLYQKYQMTDFAIADKYIRRIWTDANYARNVDLDIDRQIAIWHLPAEKKFGIKKIYQQWCRDGNLFSYSEEKLQQLLEVSLNLRPTKWSLVYRKSRYLAKKILQSLRLLGRG